ncbi:hypothetical protein WME79_36020 [Sorangium sp. So ce726]|uniref:hypothetical protein n=1 Tax=Sorangium sp. So ce726 TaxID=3133319 RepID=UPI003F5E0178
MTSVSGQSYRFVAVEVALFPDGEPVPQPVPTGVLHRTVAGEQNPWILLVTHWTPVATLSLGQSVVQTWFVVDDGPGVQ